ncbi:hypothetical protein [Streptomyces sp. NPDC058279]|uniref:hypothetical protein n=1 Tax=Streptomyces sp. NPDC058279 TaxID=3346418 RepID=UPI0036DFF54F
MRLQASVKAIGPQRGQLFAGVAPMVQLLVGGLGSLVHLVENGHIGWWLGS